MNELQQPDYFTAYVAEKLTKAALNKGPALLLTCKEKVVRDFGYLIMKISRDLHTSDPYKISYYVSCNIQDWQVSDIGIVVRKLHVDFTSKDQ